MTVSSATPYVSYNGDGATDEFAVTFPFYEIAVTLIDANGVETAYAEGTDYDVTLGGEGLTGTIVVDAAAIPASGEVLHIRRVTTRTQTLDIVNNDAFDADSVEEVLDRTIMMIQELRALFDDVFGYDARYKLETQQFKPLSAAPSSPVEGMVALSDGTADGTFGDDGEGLYRYTSGSVWAFLG